LDFRLGVSVDCMPLCTLLTKAGVPFVLHTGYTLLDGGPNVPVLQKPATPVQLVAAVAALLGAALPAPRVAPRTKVDTLP
jgi:hypothetical protein